MLAAGGCAIFDLSNDYTGSARSASADSERMKEVIKQANYEVYNAVVLRNPENWKGRIISYSGSVVERPFYEQDDRYLEVVGYYNNYLIDFILVLDHPIRKQENIYDQVESITNGKSVRVFAEMTGIEEFTFESGNKRRMPVAQLIAVYNQSDRLFLKPIWLRRGL